MGLLGWKLAENSGDDVEDFRLTVLRESLCHIFKTGTQHSGIGGPYIENHDHLALGDVVRVKLFYQTGDGGRIIANGVLAERARECPQVVK